MDTEMSFEMRLLRKSFIAHFANKRPLTRVDTEMPFKGMFTGEALVAFAANERLFFWTLHCMIEEKNKKAIKFNWLWIQIIIFSMLILWIGEILIIFVYIAKLSKNRACGVSSVNSKEKENHPNRRDEKVMLLPPNTPNDLKRNQKLF